MKRKKSNNTRWLCTALAAIIVISILTVGIVPVSAVQIVERSIDPVTVPPGGVVDVTIEFDTAESYLFMEIRDGVEGGLPAGWTVTDLEATPEPDEVEVDPGTGEAVFAWMFPPEISSGTEVTVKYKLHVSGDENPGTYSLAGTLRKSTGPEYVPIIGDDTIEVKAPYGVDLTVDDDTKTTDADVNATYYITVENTGAEDDTYDLSITIPSGADLEVLSEDSVTIPGGGSEEVELNVASFLAGNYDTTVEARSTRDPSVSDSIPVTTTVRAFYGVGLEVTPEERTVAPDENAVYTLTVTNSGNADDTIDLVITSNEADFGALSEATFPLSAGASGTADLTVRDSNVGIYDTTVRATSQEDTDKTDSVTVTTNVTEVEDTTPPYTSGHNPAKDATNVPIDTNIVVHVKDDGAGVNQATIVMTVEGETVTPVITGSTTDYTLTYDPPADFGYEQVVDVTIDASDLAATLNVMPQDAYSFTTQAAPAPKVVINEFIPDPEGDDNAPMPEGEWVELYNLGDAEVNVSGWVLYDSVDTNELYITPENTNTGDTIVPANGWLVVYRDGDGDFSLNQDADEVRLYDGYPVADSNLIDETSYASSTTGQSWARIPDGTGEWQEADPTPGETNGAPISILDYYRSWLTTGDPNVVETQELLKAADDWRDDVVPPGFTDPITTQELLQLAEEWAAT